MLVVWQRGNNTTRWLSLTHCHVTKYTALKNKWRSAANERQVKNYKWHKTFIFFYFYVIVLKMQTKLVFWTSREMVCLNIAYLSDGGSGFFIPPPLPALL